jgi:hypothetical protein
VKKKADVLDGDINEMTCLMMLNKMQNIQNQISEIKKATQEIALRNNEAKHKRLTVSSLVDCDTSKFFTISPSVESDAQKRLTVTPQVTSRERK